MRKGPLVLPRPSAADGMASSGRSSETPRDLPVQIDVEDLVRQFDESQGPNCEVSDSNE